MGAFDLPYLRVDREASARTVTLSAADALTLRRAADLLADMTAMLDRPWESSLEDMRTRKALLTPIDHLEISVRAHNCLKAASIRTLADLARHTKRGVLRIRNAGPRTVSELETILSDYGLSFDMDVDRYLDTSAQ